MIPSITALTLSVVVSASTIAGFQDKPGVNDTGRVMADFKARVDKYALARRHLPSLQQRMLVVGSDLQDFLVERRRLRPVIPVPANIGAQDVFFLEVHVA